VRIFTFKIINENFKNNDHNFILLLLVRYILECFSLSNLKRPAYSVLRKVIDTQCRAKKRKRRGRADGEGQLYLEFFGCYLKKNLLRVPISHNLL
jgi:hypothetical protein